MALTCSKGHVNDDTNRFCEQCGEPLQPATSSAATAVSSPVGSDATMSAGGGSASITCPVCGQENVPGTAFCDNCGAALPPPQPAAEAAVPQELAVGAPDGGSASPSATTAATVACPQCGTPNDAANRFCDNCGAKLEADSAGTDGDTAGAAGPVNTPDMDEAATDATVVQSSLSTPLPTEGTEPPILTEAAAPAFGNGSESAPASPAVDENGGSGAPASTTPVSADELVGASQAAGTSATSAAQPAPGVDGGAERQRLQEQIETQRKLVEQLEQMQAAFGAAIPPAIRQGLDEARATLAQREQELADLTGGTAVAHPLPTALDVATQRADDQAPAAATTVPASAPVPEPAPPAPAPVEAAAPSTPPVAPQPVQPASASTPAPVRGTDQLPPAPAAAGPRFVSRDGKTIPLAQTGRDLVIGREDPISGIHPEIDLTPHGGEAGGVSRRHAILRQQGGQWMVTDLDSTNYTRIDGNRLAPNTPTPLNDGSRVQFGRVEFEFHAS